jgi:hypothetical protein
MLMRATISPNSRSCFGQKESPAGANRRGFLFSSEVQRQRPVFIVLSVQLAADSASAAAPRTVLQAESAMHVPTSNAVINFDFMSTLPYMSETTWRHLLLLSTVCPMNGITLSMKKCPARQFAGEAFFYCCNMASV